MEMLKHLTITIKIYLLEIRERKVTKNTSDSAIIEEVKPKVKNEIYTANTFKAKGKVWLDSGGFYLHDESELLLR